MNPEFPEKNQSPFPEKEGAPFANPYESPTTSPANDYQPTYDYQEPHRGAIVLVLGLTSMGLFMLSLMCCLPITFVAAPFGMGAWFMGRADLGKINQGRMDPSGRDQLNIGSIVGLVGGILSLIACLIQGAFIAILIVGIAAGGAGP